MDRTRILHDVSVCVDECLHTILNGSYVCKINWIKRIAASGVGGVKFGIRNAVMRLQLLRHNPPSSPLESGSGRRTIWASWVFCTFSIRFCETMAYYCGSWWDGWCFNHFLAHFKRRNEKMRVDMFMLELVSYLHATIFLVSKRLFACPWTYLLW